MDKLVRRRTTCGLANVRRLAVLAGLCAGLAFGAAMDGGAAAHSGRLAQDGCHKDNKVGERHWHVEGVKRGGPCVERDGTVTQLTDDGAERPAGN